MTGLSSLTARERLKKFGKNILKVKKANPWWKIALRQFSDIMVLILLGAAIISFLLGDTKDAAVIFVIVLLNGCVGFSQEFRTERTIEVLKKMIHPTIRVFRDDKEIMISTEFIVPGDVVILAEGDKIPADGILIKSNSLAIDESSLTGESLPVEKKKNNEVFMGTSVTHGSGFLEVKEIGMRTKFGRIADMTATTPQDLSPLQKELTQIGLFVTKVILILCSVLFVVDIIRSTYPTWSEKIINSLMFSVAVALGAIPEGLPTTITVALALGATALARRKAIMKKLSSVETLGAVTTICSDKTGTLTQNEMTVREIYLADHSIYSVSGSGYDPHSGKISYLGGNEKKETFEVLKKVIEVCHKCNDAQLIEKEEKFLVLGDPTEGALLTLVQKAQLTIFSAHDDFQKIIKEKTQKIFPFDSDRKMMSVISNNHIWVKGSPDQILKNCDSFFDGEKEHPLTLEKREYILNHYERMAENALRVLAFAGRAMKKGQKINSEKKGETSLVFYGLVGMIDPPRSEVREAVTQCHTAGIRIIVITGDYGVTAEVIARELGIVRGKEVIVLTGDETQKMSDSALSKLLIDKKKQIIFARSLPDQKMRIIDLLQAKGEVVAMTGDGVNDAPALKSADIGVAMGIAGTEVAKEASTMVLTDDSFASIVAAIYEGRRIYDNLKKFVVLIFTNNFGELVAIFIPVLLRIPMGLTAILILCIDLGTELLPAIALGVDDAADDIMNRKPRDPHAKIMNPRFVKNFLFSGIEKGIYTMIAFLWSLSQGGWIWGLAPSNENLLHSQTIAFTTLVIANFVHTYSARTLENSSFRQKFFSNHLLFIANLCSLLMVLCILYIPFLNNALSTTPLNQTDWIVVLIFAIIPFFTTEIRKYLLHQKKKFLLS